ncbi:hypothetical protein B0T25DRAFT_566815 [Lasiosphaeria hispida]|uniref:WSC domain-containing protein n=1 Tax=Lasiosphaeria hispida TaxID=260671 RepID=A0AAJ0MG91_9PEZI|nr:hypothetical protein B0T25DRAFT_566815 [Lasiosphaeria hispida]
MRTNLDLETMTVEKRVASCMGNGYRYAGLVYYGSQTCGGNDYFSVYQDPNFLPSEEADVEDYSPLGNSLATETYLSRCKPGGYLFARTEYGGECFCGVVIGNDTYAAPATDCSIPCNGDASESCGGRSRLNLYVAEELQSPFKLYDDAKSSNCRRYPRHACTNACADACKQQYDNCNSTYAQGCKEGRGLGSGGHRRAGQVHLRLDRLARAGRDQV